MRKSTNSDRKRSARRKFRLMYLEVGEIGCAIELIEAGNLDPCGAAPVQRFMPWAFWESLVSGASLVEHFRNRAGPRYKNCDVGTREIWDLATRGNTAAQSALVREAVFCARGLAQLILEHRPSVVMLGGCVFQGAPDLIMAIQHVIDTCLLVPENTTELVAGSFGDSALPICAAAL